jgi:hypothetical protein
VLRIHSVLPRVCVGLSVCMASPVSVLTDECVDALSQLRELINTSHLTPHVASSILRQVSLTEKAFEEQVMCIFSNVARDDREKQARLLRKVPPGDREVSEFPNSMNTSPLNGSVISTAITPTKTDKQNRSKKVHPLELAAKYTMASMYLIAEAAAATVKAERAIVYGFYRTSNVLKGICTVPHSVLKVAMASHSGVPGVVFSSGIAFSISIESEEQLPLVKYGDEMLGTDSKNVICFPILDRTMQPIGVVELTNKLHGKVMWNEADESVVYHAALLLSHVMTAYPEVDLISSPAFDPSHSLHPTKPWQLEDSLLASLGLEIPSAILDSSHPQLVLRSGAKETLGSAMLANPPNARAPTATTPTLGKEHERAKAVVTSSSLKEVYSYVSTLEESYRQGLNNFVHADKDRKLLSDEIQRKNHAIRILEENKTSLEDSVTALTNELREANASRQSHTLDKFAISSGPKRAASRAGLFGIDHDNKSTMSRMSSARKSIVAPFLHRKSLAPSTAPSVLPELVPHGAVGADGTHGARVTGRRQKPHINGHVPNQHGTVGPVTLGNILRHQTTRSLRYKPANESD